MKKELDLVTRSVTKGFSNQCSQTTLSSDAREGMRVHNAIDAGSDCDCSADDPGGACGQCERKPIYFNRNRIHFPQCEKTVNRPLGQLYQKNNSRLRLFFDETFFFTCAAIAHPPVFLPKIIHSWPLFFGETGLYSIICDVTVYGNVHYLTMLVCR